MLTWWFCLPLWLTQYTEISYYRTWTNFNITLYLKTLTISMYPTWMTYSHLQVKFWPLYSYRRRPQLAPPLSPAIDLPIKASNMPLGQIKTPSTHICWYPWVVNYMNAVECDTRKAQSHSTTNPICKIPEDPSSWPSMWWDGGNRFLQLIHAPPPTHKRAPEVLNLLIELLPKE